MTKVEHFLAWLASNVDALFIGALVALGIVAVMLLLRAAGRYIIRDEPDCNSWWAVIGRVLAKTSILFMIFAALDIVVTYAEPPARIGRLFDVGFVIAFALQGAVWGRELILGVIGRQIEDDDPSESTLANAMSLIRVLVSVGLFALALIVILDNLGVNVTALVAGLGIGGIAIGLAAQGIFADLFAALSILFDRPFRRGDTIRYDQTTGIVDRIGLKTTRLRALSGEQVVMANTKLLEREIHNLAKGNERLVTLHFGLVYQTPADKLERVRTIAQNAVESQSGCRMVRCVMTGFGPSSLDHELSFTHEGLDADAMFHKREAVMVALLRGFAAEDIQFAYPTQTTFTAAPDGTLVMPYPPRSATSP